MAENRTVSILMAFRNTERFLRECLDSVLAQTDSDWELIAVDDSSSDGSRELVESYAAKDPRVKVFSSDGRGLIPTLQTCYRHSTGAYINRMDSDDRMPATKVAVLREALEAHGPGNMAVGLVEHFAEDGVKGGFRMYEDWLNELTRREANYEGIWKECVIQSHCWLVYRADFDRAGAFNPERYPEDYDLSFRFFRAGLKVRKVDVLVHLWRDRPDRISRTEPEYLDQTYYDLKLKYFDELAWDGERTLVIWGAGPKGKKLARKMQELNMPFEWVTNNQKKAGLHIYDVLLKQLAYINELENPMVISAVSGPDDRKEVFEALEARGLQHNKDFFMFC